MKYRQYVADYGRIQTEIFDKYSGDKSETRAKNQIAELDDLNEEIGASMPMLKVIHHMQVFQALRQLDPSAAVKRMEVVVESIRQVESSGLSKKSGWEELRGHSKNQDWKQVKARRSSYYRDLGYGRLADFYEDWANSKY